MKLSKISKGMKAIITKINADEEFSTRFRDLGIVKGCKVEFTGKAPLKDPLKFKINGNSISLRIQEAEMVEVEVVKWN